MTRRRSSWSAARTTDGWKFDFYRNTAYHCAISGYQTFVIGTKVGSSADGHPSAVGEDARRRRRLLRSPPATPQPNAANKTEESATTLRNRLDDGLSTRVTSGPEGWRFLAVSMCSHDIYAGTNTPDANNPNTNADGTPVTTNGLLATKAAIAFTMSQYPTDDYFLHGGSAGSAGSFNVAWGMQLQGQPPTGIVADSGILNQSYEQAQIDQHLPCARTAQTAAIVPTRFDVDIANPANQPDLILADGRFTVPDHARLGPRRPQRLRLHLDRLPAAQRHQRHHGLGRLRPRADAGGHRRPGPDQPLGPTWRSASTTRARSATATPTCPPATAPGSTPTPPSRPTTTA